MLKLDKEWEENKLQLFLYSDGVGSQVPPQILSKFFVFAKVAKGRKLQLE